MATFFNLSSVWIHLLLNDPSWMSWRLFLSIPFNLSPHNHFPHLWRATSCEIKQNHAECCLKQSKWAPAVWSWSTGPRKTIVFHFLNIAHETAAAKGLPLKSLRSHLITMLARIWGNQACLKFYISPWGAPLWKEYVFIFTYLHNSTAPLQYHSQLMRWILKIREWHGSLVPSHDNSATLFSFQSHIGFLKIMGHSGEAQ